jgi:hypothetical protein
MRGMSFNMPLRDHHRLFDSNDDSHDPVEELSL